jgi:hypothetical protein
VHDTDAYPVIFFVLSFYAFGTLLVYSLARAWEQALLSRPTFPKVELQAHANDESGLSSRALSTKGSAAQSETIQLQDRGN